jgi:hypothetical protein
MASMVLCHRIGAGIVPRVNRRKTRQDTDRIKEVQNRLDMAVAEARRLRGELDALRSRDEIVELRKMLRRQAGRYPYRITYDDRIR